MLNSCSVLLSLFVLLFASCSLALGPTDPALPVLSTQYSAFFSQNLLSLQLTNGAPQSVGSTEEFYEAYDGSRFLRSRGRFGPISQQEIVDRNKSLAYRWDENQPRTCNTYRIASSTPGRFVEPSLLRLFSSCPNMSNPDQWTYQGQTNEVRAIPTQKYFVSCPGAPPGTFNSPVTMRNYTMFFPLSGSSLSIAPLRIEVNIEFRRFNEVYYTESISVDSFQYRDGAPDSALFTIPSYCADPDFMSPAYSALPEYPIPPQFATGAARPADINTPIPRFPTAFSMFLELRASDSVTALSVDTYSLAVDNSMKLRRVDWSSADGINRNTQIFDDSAIPGRTYLFSSASGQCQNLFQSSAPQNPVDAVHEQFLSSFLPDPNGFFRSRASFAGQKIAREVTADVWSLTQLVTRNGITYNSTYSFLFFPRGWIFYGRPTIDEQTPLRVEITGTASGPGGDFTYSDAFGFFFYSPVAPSASTFSPSQFGCPLVPSGSPTANSTVSLPRVPYEYSTYVIANFLDRGYTLAYREFYSNSQRKMRTEGRGGAINLVEIIDFASGNATQFPRPGSQAPNGATQSCKSTSYPLQALANGQLSPSVGLFDSFLASFSSVEYIGQNANARTIPCDVYRVVASRVVRNVTLSSWVALIYYAVNPPVAAPAGYRVPVRIQLDGSITDLRSGSTVREFHHFYDYIAFTSIAPAPSLFTVPASVSPCPFVSPQSLSAFQRISNAVKSSPSSANLALPYQGSTFSTLIETKLHDTANDVYSMFWSAGRLGELERIDFTPSAAFPQGRSFIYDLTKTPTVNGMPQRGVVYSIVPTNLTDGSVFSCRADWISDVNPHFLYSLRAGSVPSAFQPPQGLSQFLGRSAPVRAAVADAYITPNLQVYNSASGIKYLFSRTSYVFAEEWQFPGRPSSLARVPLRLVNSGSFGPNGNELSYSDVWDFFLFNTNLPDVASVNPLNFGCASVWPAGYNPSAPSNGCPSDQSSQSGIFDNNTQFGLSVGLAVLGLIFALFSLGLYIHVNRSKYRAQAGGSVLQSDSKRLSSEDFAPVTVERIEMGQKKKKSSRPAGADADEENVFE